MLGTRPSGGVVIPDAASQVFAGHQVHLFLEQDLVEVVHLPVGAAVVISRIRVLVDCAGRIQLEAFDAIVQEGLEVVHPVFLTGLGLAVPGCDRIFLGDAEVIFLAEPEAQVEAHVAQLADEEAVVELLGVFVLEPVRLGGEFLEVPLLLRGEVVALFHPLRFQPEDVAGNAQLAEEDRVVQDVPLILAHVGTEAEAVGPFRHHVVATGDARVLAQQFLHRGGSHQVEIGLVAGVVDIEMVLVGVGDVEEVLAGGVVVHRPARGTHHERHRDLRVLVGRPHAEQLAPVLDVLAAGAAAAVEALILGEGEAQKAGFQRVAALAVVDSFLAVVLVADDAAVLGHVQVGIGVIDDLGQAGD